MRMADHPIERRHRFMVFKMPLTATKPPLVALDLPGISGEQIEVLRQIIAPHLGDGFVLAVDSEIVARGPVMEEQPAPLHEVMRLTEMAVQQHEYMCAELRRMREEYEQDFAQERTILRTLRGRWLERVCDDQVRGEDALRYLVETARSVAKKADPPKPDGES